MKIYGLLIVLCFSINISTFAQADTLSRLQKINVTLNAFLQTVSKNNIEYAAEKYNVSIAEATVQMAKVFPDPTLSGSWIENRANNERTGYGYSTELGTTIELRGKRKARISLANSQKQLSNALLNDYFRNLRADAAILFIEAKKQIELYNVKMNSFRTMEKLSKADSIRLQLGSIMEADAEQSKLETGILYNELLEAEAMKINALQELNLIAGVDNKDTTFIPNIKMETLSRLFSLTDLIEYAVANRTDAVSAQLNVDVAKKSATLVKKERTADLDVSLGLEDGYSVPGIGYGEKIITAGVAIPLKISNFNKGELIAAELYRQQTEKYYEYVKMKITTEVTQAYQNYVSAQKQVINFENNLLHQSEKVFKGKVYSYQRGETSLLEVLNAQRTYNEIQLTYIESIAESHKSLIELERVAGIWDINF